MPLPLLPLAPGWSSGMPGCLAAVLNNRWDALAVWRVESSRGCTRAALY